MRILSTIKLVPMTLLEEARNSCRGLRMMAGLAGFGLPLILLFGGWIAEGKLWMGESLSAYYHSSMRDYFVGLLFTIGLILLADLGEDDQGRLRRLLGPLAGISAIGTAVSPTWPPSSSPSSEMLFALSDPVVIAGYRHVIFASLLFLSLILISLIVFPNDEAAPLASVESPPPLAHPTATSRSKQVQNPIDRNAIYSAAGMTMTIFGLAIFIYYMIPSHFQALISWARPVFWLETFMIWAFAAAWWTKSQEMPS